MSRTHLPRPVICCPLSLTISLIVRWYRNFNSWLTGSTVNILNRSPSSIASMPCASAAGWSCQYRYSVYIHTWHVGWVSWLLETLRPVLIVDDWSPTRRRPPRVCYWSSQYYGSSLYIHRAITARSSTLFNYMKRPTYLPPSGLISLKIILLWRRDNVTVL